MLSASGAGHHPQRPPSSLVVSSKLYVSVLQKRGEMVVLLTRDDVLYRRIRPVKEPTTIQWAAYRLLFFHVSSTITVVVYSTVLCTCRRPTGSGQQDLELRIAWFLRLETEQEVTGDMTSSVIQAGSPLDEYFKGKSFSVNIVGQRSALLCTYADTVQMR